VRLVQKLWILAASADCLLFTPISSFQKVSEFDEGKDRTTPLGFRVFGLCFWVPPYFLINSVGPGLITDPGTRHRPTIKYTHTIIYILLYIIIYTIKYISYRVLNIYY
jgi:hypothetical protein